MNGASEITTVDIKINKTWYPQNLLGIEAKLVQYLDICTNGFIIKDLLDLLNECKICIILYKWMWLWPHGFYNVSFH